MAFHEPPLNQQLETLAKYKPFEGKQALQSYRAEWSPSRSCCPGR